ncbi:sialate O-acetylesterase [Lewinella sp. 4G2]|uniref:sialate O-acetylesterase n=1 Tax=Lewinella sp. 4G2 TaxID=1803372 RepID=UPI0007B4D977|nr:sialate O-acetylesterase [Lewinella sp. 4G2]OAV45467.1 hypothetical protein A3850_013630 [Lewinella sp. 4G2]
MRHLFTSLLLSMLCTCVSAQELSFFETFANHAVLQRNVNHPLWGWAPPGKKVQITFGEKVMSVKADKSGRWKTTLPPTKAGGPYKIAIQSGRERVSIEDVYFGDVYLLSGQSNMEWRLAQSDESGERAKAIADPLIREIKVDHVYDGQPREHLQISYQYGPDWMVGDAETIGDFSGVGSYFAHYLRKEVDVPIGLLHSSWGGSRIEPWMSPEALGITGRDALKDQQDALEIAGEIGRAAFEKNFPGREIPTEDKGEAMGWLTPDFDDSDWPTMTLPTFWEAAGYPSVDGYFYFRKDINLTTEQAAGKATLYLGAIDDGDYTYVNGKLVGSYPSAYSTPRVYTLEPGVLKAGVNQLTFRIFDGQGGGGFSASPEAFYLETESGKVSLAGDYKYNIGEFKIDANPNQIATILYNAMIAPLEGMPLSGVLWYQGESNAGEGDNVAYAGHMKNLIRQWRGFFDHPGTLPFYWVQLANFQDEVKSANEPGWATIRQSQTDALSEPVTGMAVITDIGEADDIHPRNKWEVGRRLSLHALQDVYDRDVVADSPMALSAKSLFGDASMVDIQFANAAGGLKVMTDDPYGYVRGFTMQDADGEWHFAPAISNGGSGIMVVHPTGGDILRVRYNWANNPDGNLFSQEGLPVNAFDLEVK